MENSTKPKTSLFKQKIKQIRNYNPQQSSSFPKPVKIDLTAKQEPIPPKEDQKFVKNFLSSTLSPKELNEIEDENWKKISQMKPQEIEKYQEMMMKDLPANLLKKVKQPQQPKQQPKQEEPILKNTLGTLESLAVDVRTWQVTFLTHSLMISEEIVGCQNLKLMLGSENNQTQIIGCKILTHLCKGIMTRKTNKQVDLLRINGIPFHVKMLTEDIAYNLFRALMMSMSRTSFASCWVEMLASLTESLELLFQFLNRDFLLEVLQFLKKQKVKKNLNYKQFEEEGQQKNAHFLTQKSILLMVEKIEERLKQEKQSQVLSLFEKEINIPVLLELILLEEAQNFYQFKKLLDKLKPQIDEIDYMEAMCICYRLCKELKKIQLKNKNIVEVVKGTIYRVWENQLRYCLSKIHKYPPINAYYVLFCVQYIKTWEFINYIEQKVEGTSDVIVNIITYLTIQQYSNRPCTPSQINNIQQMLQFVSFNIAKHEPELVFISLLNLFHQDQQSFSSINEALLNQTFKSLSLNDEQLWSFLTVESVRDLMRVYNYNSFGNYCFTRVMLYLLASCQESVCGLMLEEVVQRYPFLFYYACEGQQVYGGERIYHFRNTNVDEKLAVYKMLEVNEKLNKSNIFVRYLINQ